MSSQISVNPQVGAVVPQTEGLAHVAPDVFCQRLGIVNVIFFGSPRGQWVLIDAGLPGTANKIQRQAKELFTQSKPCAIILTHGHFDHVGALRELCDLWEAPVYAHPLEWPYLDGRSQYPPPDPTVGGGLMAALSPLYPRGPVNVGGRLRGLPADGSVPFMPGWRWIATPGHTPGHISLWREADRTLIAGDAFITTNQESAYAVATQKPEVHGPPMYYTQDWEQARDAVHKLASLAPRRAATGHGPPLESAELSTGLRLLAENFDSIAKPRHGRYVHEPVRSDLTGTVYVPPQLALAERLGRFVASPLGIGIVAGLTFAGLALRGRRRRSQLRGEC